jgi:hypothetical protein
MKNTKIWLALILICAVIVGSLSLNWGLPNAQHIYTYSSDEMTYLKWLQNMNPARRDFNPKVYTKTHLSIYATAAVLAAGQAAGLYRIGSKEYYKDNPNDFRRIILLERLFFGRLSVIVLILVSFLIGQKLIDDRFGLLLAGVTGFLPTILVNGGYAVENVMLATLMIITFYQSLRYYQSGKLKYLLWAGIFAGLSISAKQTGILSVIFILGALFSMRRQLGIAGMVKHFILWGLACVVAFSVTSPFYARFLIMKVVSPASVQPDLHRGTTSFMIPLRLELSYIASNVAYLVKTLFVQTGGLLLLLAPVGMYFNRKRPEFRVMLVFVALFFAISSLVVWVADPRLIPMTYFLVLMGAACIYRLFTRPGARVLKGVLGGLLVLSLAAYAVIIEYRYLSEDQRVTSSEWIEENILSKADSVTIGLNAAPFFSAPHIITKEWTHNKHPDSALYPDVYNETFVIPDHEIGIYGGQQIVPDTEIASDEDKMRWLESMAPEYVIIFYSAGYGYTGGPEHFSKSGNYELIKLFPKYDVMGVSALVLYSYDIHIFRRVTPGSA